MTVQKNKRYTSNIKYVYVPTKITFQAQIIYRKLNQHQKQDIGRHILDLAYAIELNANRANSVYVVVEEERSLRLKYLIEAHANCSALLGLIDNLQDSPLKEFSIDDEGKRIKKYLIKTNLIIELCSLCKQECELLKGVIKQTRDKEAKATKE